MKNEAKPHVQLVQDWGDDKILINVCYLTGRMADASISFEVCILPKKKVVVSYLAYPSGRCIIPAQYTHRGIQYSKASIITAARNHITEVFNRVLVAL